MTTATQAFKVGDRIVFRAVTRSGAPRLNRIIVRLDRFGRPEVRAHGWSNFVVNLHEIIETIPAAPQNTSA